MNTPPAQAGGVFTFDTGVNASFIAKIYGDPSINYNEEYTGAGGGISGPANHTVTGGDPIIIGARVGDTIDFMGSLGLNDSLYHSGELLDSYNAGYFLDATNPAVSLVSASGHNYASVVPIPDSGVLFASAVALLGVVGCRKRYFRT